MKKLLARAVPVAVVALAAVWLVTAMLPPRQTGPMRVEELAKLPVMHLGRVKPFDSMARNSLRIISGRQTFVPADARTRRSWFGSGPDKPIKEPATRWLLDVMAGKDNADAHRVFRIEHAGVLEAMGVQARSGWRYALNELKESLSPLAEQVDQARQIDARRQTLFQAKILELGQHLQLYTLIAQLRVPLVVHPEAADQQWTSLLDIMAGQLSADEHQRALEHIGHAVVNQKAEMLAEVAQKQTGAGGAWATMLAAYGRGDADTFNQQVAAFGRQLAEQMPKEVRRARFEAFFNRMAPLYRSSVLYVMAFVLVCLGWLGWSRPLNRAAMGLLILTLLVHTFALVGRIYLQGRPPVTNLYSSAVFVAWGCVVLAVVLEWVMRNGIGTALGAATGFGSLLVALNLAEGDTLEQMRAVLDTNFWLATHVTTITLGYAATFIAGFLGILFILRGVLTRSLSAEMSDKLARMIYGTICFATLLSFTGTVLGGIWADQSWGRFWGWDPKENGALLLVLWNALILHARWGHMIKQRGLAVLAVLGNIVTAWAWFGVNMLGVGLHSYGFMEGAALALACFALSQILIAAVGLIPLRAWASFESFEVTTQPDNTCDASIDP